MSTAAPSVAVVAADGVVAITGTVTWSNVRDGVFLARATTSYTLTVPIAGTPFDPAFTRPDFGANPAFDLPGRASFVIGDPKTSAENDSATGLRMALFAAPQNEVGPGDSRFGLIVESFTRSFAPGRLDGDQTFQVILSFDESFKVATAVIVAMQVRTPVISSGSSIVDPFISTDIVSTELYRGDNRFETSIPVGDSSLSQPEPGSGQTPVAPEALPPGFDPLAYIASHPDLRAAFGDDPAAGGDHFLFVGRAEGRVITFDGLAYIASHVDLIGALGADPAAGALHFIRHGAAEDRAISFEALEYIASHGDLIGALGPDAAAGARHFILHGAAEGRETTFDGLEYVAAYADLSAAFGADDDAGARHYIEHGFAEGRDARFDALRYIAGHGDLIAAFGRDAEAGARHFIENGRAEGRAADRFDPADYLMRFEDLRAAFGDDLDAATQHFIAFGAAEGRLDGLL